jgi:hemolysin III
MLAVYTSSTFYHGWAESEHKEWLHKVDHACVYVFIAGTATPFLTWIGDPSSWSALGVLWAITIVCVYLSLSAFDVSEKYSHWFAGALAILASITVCLLAKCMPFEGVLMFMAGVTTYFSGMYFYLNRSIKHHHVLWHMAVLVGSTLHYFTVMLYVLPSLVVL